MSDNQRHTLNDLDPAPGKATTPIIAIGVSQRARDCLLRLLASGAFVSAAACVVFDVSDAAFAQTAGSTDELPPITPEELSQHGAVWARNGAVLRPGAILVAPRGTVLALSGDRLSVAPGAGDSALDMFGLSLARSTGDVALVMLTSATFAGAFAAAALRERGHLTVAAAECGAAFAAPVVTDTVLPLADIPGAIAAHWQPQRPSSSAAASRVPVQAPWGEEAAALRQIIKHDFAAHMRNKPAGGRLRLWVVGCGSGEMVYSLAVALREDLPGSIGPLQIFATDIDDRSLSVARAGRYPADLVARLSPERLERWFLREGATAIVRPELRELCVFSPHNLLCDPPFSRVDLVVCRLPLGLLAPHPRQDALQRLDFALRPASLLWLSPTGPGLHDAAPFEAAAGSERLFRRPEQPLTVASPELQTVPHWLATPSLARWREAGAATMKLEAERIAASHGPAFVVVDAKLNTLHFSPRVGRFISPAAGGASLNLLQLVHPDLRPILSALLDHVASTQHPAHSGRLVIHTDSGKLALVLRAEPMAHTVSDQQRYLVLFQDSSDGAELEAGLSEHRAVTALAAANQELQVSREELHSLGEEFDSVNHELTQRLSELARANSDLRNVLESTRIAIVFLDNQLQVQGFTPAATAVIEVGAEVVGRPVEGCALRVHYPDLLADARDVLRSLGTIEREVSGVRQVGGQPDGRHYLARVLPYRRVDNFIAGVVLTFLDVTAAFEAERAKRESEERFRVMADVVPAFLFITDPQGAWQYVNPPFYAFTGLPAGAALQDGWWAAVQADDAASSRQAWRDALQAQTALEMECRFRRADGGEAWFLVRATPQLGLDGRATGWFGSCTNVDAGRRAGRMQQLLLGELQHRVKNILAVVRSVMLRTVESSHTMDDLAAHLSGRIGALARIEGVIARSGGQAATLSELVDEELAAHGGQMDRQIAVEGPTVLLTTKVAESLGLALHELTVNAIKYGSLSVANGRLRIRWQTHPVDLDQPLQQRLVFEWQESGVPITDLQPSRSGFGRELLERGLPYALGATTSLEFRPGGIRWLVEFQFQSSQPTGLLQESNH